MRDKIRQALFRFPHQRLSLRSHLVMLVLGAVVPLLLLVAIMFWQYSKLQYETVERGMRATARALSLAVDRDVGTIHGILETLAASSYLDAQDFRSFYELCLQLAKDRPHSRIILFDHSGQQVINTLRPFGSLLPNLARDPVPPNSDQDYPDVSLGAPEVVMAALQTGRLVVSDLFIAKDSNQPTVGVTLPVLRDGEVRYGLQMAFFPRHLTELMLAEGLSTDWVARLIDRRGVFIAHNRDPDRHVGRPAMNHLRDQIARAEDGWSPGRNRDGVLVYDAFTRSKATQWTVAIGVPASIITAPLQRHITFFAAGAGALLFCSLGLAVVLGRRISTPIANLAGSAEAIQRGEEIQLPQPPVVREVKELHDALSAAGVGARNAALERERRLIAEAKQIEAERAKQQITYNLESMSDGYCAFDSEWRFTYVNAKAEEELVRQRFSKNDILGRVLWEVFPEHAGSAWQKALMGAMRERVPTSLSFYYPPLDYWYEDRIYPAPDGGIGIFRRNITEQKLAEAALRKSEEQARRDLEDMTLLEQLSRQLVKSGEVEALMQHVINAAIAITRAQRGTLQLFEPESGLLKTASQLGFEKPFLKFFEHVKRGEDACGIAAQRGERVIVEDVLLSEIFAGTPAERVLIDAGVRAVQSTPLFSRSGELLGVISTHFVRPYRPAGRDLRLLDVLARQAADFIERCRAEETRQEMDRRKDEFLAMLGHELRNPLGIVSNFVHLLRMKTPLDPTLVELREMMARQVQHMTRLLDDLLDVSRISRGRLRLNEELCDFTEIARATTEDYRNVIELNGLQVTLELPIDPVWVKGDRVRLAQAIGNILHNANKFTESGGTINIRVYEEPSRNRVILTVRDSGIGMEPDILAHAFEFFTQAERSVDRSRGGLGLGLALVKGLIELQGGEVSAASDGAGRGTEIIVALPRQEPAVVAGKPIRWPVEGSRSYRMLVIEDNPAAALTTQKLLMACGHTVEVAHTGEAALEMAKRFRPEVVLCDIGLPGMDGYSVARELRQDPALAESFLIAATGYGTFADQRRAREAGFDVHLRKPIDFDELQRIFSSLTLSYTAPETTEEVRTAKMRALWK